MIERVFHAAEGEAIDKKEESWRFRNKAWKRNELLKKRTWIMALTRGRKKVDEALSFGILS